MRNEARSEQKNREAKRQGAILVFSFLMFQPPQFQDFVTDYCADYEVRKVRPRRAIGRRIDADRGADSSQNSQQPWCVVVDRLEGDLSGRGTSERAS